MTDACTKSKILLISANVGSVFENAQIAQNWSNEVLKVLEDRRAVFVAIHLQEVGGKHFKNSMHKVDDFLSDFQCRVQDLGYDSGCIYYDKDFETDIFQFTALGCLYLIHNSYSGAIQRWNFGKETYENIQGFTVECDALEECTTMQKHRFPQHFYPSSSWFRKGYMRTRWKINDDVFDLVNVHLFHDESNLVAIESPLHYASLRKKSLLHTLDRIAASPADGGVDSSTPLFVFGDMNFRLNLARLVQHLTPGSSCTCVELSPTSKKDKSVALEYKTDESHCVLRVERKRFLFTNSRQLETDLWPELRELDTEPKDTHGLLHEAHVGFMPTYPWVEDPSLPCGFMRTRAPAWCDRVLMNREAWDTFGNKCTYDAFGLDTCMGDHKPVYLWFELSE